MALFRRKVVLSDDVPSETNARQRRDSIIKEIEHVSVQLEEVKAQLKATEKVRGQKALLDALREQVTVMEIDKSRIEEEFARERREIEHHVGLERERTELEISQARQQAQLDVREENLQAEKDRFKEHMEFYKEQMDKHIDDVKLLLNQVMTRIPTVNVDRRIRETLTGELSSGSGAE